MKKYTMQDIADSLGISKNSVSQALRNKNGVSEKTRDLVQKKAEEMGYLYNENTSKYDKRFLLITTKFAFQQKSFFGEIISSIQEKSFEKNNTVDLYLITKKDISNQSLSINLNEYNGIFILSHSSNELIKNILNHVIPAVLIDHHHPTLIVDAVLSKNAEGAYQAVSFLLEKNYKKIGFIGDINFSPSYEERFEGYKHALKDYNQTINHSFAITKIEETQGSLFRKLKELDSMPDVWFCVNSGLAFMLNNYLQSNGYKIPTDIGIMCFDDTEFTRMASPPITNIATDLIFMGRLAVDVLEKRLLYPKLPYVQHQILPEKKIRKSIK